MEDLLSSKLTQFFDNLLGEDGSSQQTDSPRKKTKNKKNKKLKKADETVEEKQEDKIAISENEETTSKEKQKKRIQDIPSEPAENSQSLHLDTQTTKNLIQNTEQKQKEFTDDGFKIVSSIPDDDSDISDAFEYDSEDEGNFNVHQDGHYKTKIDKVPKAPSKTTDDGFKIISEIPPDDSDVSDAFEDDEGLGMESEAVSENLQDNIKKPIRLLMNDFGLSKDIFHGKPQEPEVMKPAIKKRKRKGTSNTVTHAGKRKGESHVTVLDYTKRRGTGTKKTKPEEEVVESKLPESQSSKTLDEKQLKRVRYDVFKLGMSGFDKQKKEDTRVALAIKLGAKPPKNKHINYNEFLAKRKEEKKNEAEEREMKRKLGMKVFKPRKSEERPVVKAATAQVGRYKHGVQVLSRRDIEKIKKGK